MPLTYSDITAAAARIKGAARPVSLAPAGTMSAAEGGTAHVWFALEHLQHSGSFKSRGALNFLRAHRDAGTLTPAGVTIASGGNAGLACAWAARADGTAATVFLPASAPPVKVARLHDYGASVRQVGTEYADALAACEEFTEQSGALASHAYADPLVSAGAGTLVDEIRTALPDVASVIVAAGGGGLFAGVATAAQHHGIRTVAVEPTGSRALHAAIEAGTPVDVTVDSIAADALGARRASPDAVHAAQNTNSRAVLVCDEAIRQARQQLWAGHRIVVEHAAATAFAAIGGVLDGLPGRPPAYLPAPGEHVVVVLCGANTAPGDLA